MRLPIDEAALQPLHPGAGQSGLRHARGRHAENLGRDRHLLATGQNHDDSLRAGLDPAFDRLADDPQRGHGAIAAGQRRHAGRGRQRPARALQHPGPDRPRLAVQPVARLPDLAGRGRTGLQRLHCQTCTQAAASRADVLLAELRQVPRQPDEGLVRRQCHRRESLGLRLAAQAGHSRLRHPENVRHDGQGRGQWLPVPGLQPDRRLAGQKPGDEGVGQTQVAGGDGPVGYRNLGVLAQRRALQRRGNGQHPDRGHPPAHHLLRRRKRFAGQQRSLAAMALEGGRWPGAGAHRRENHGRAVLAPAQALSGRRRCLGGADPQARLALQNTG
ncbi:hypothetical protein D3C84_526180 [compost metagenome]